MPSTCEAQVSHGIVRLSGEVDASAVEVLPPAYAEAAAGADRVLLDFHDVDYINSTGIAVIVGVLAQARAAGVTVAAAGLTEHYRHVFTITRLVDFMEVLDEAGSTPT